MSDFVWWIQFVEIPALVGLFWWIQRNRAACDQATKELGEKLTSFRIEVAKEYVSANQFKEALEPMTKRLGQIEGKIDRILTNGRK